MKQLTITFKDINEVNTVLQFLGTAPYNQVGEMINRFRTQIDEQLKAMPPEKIPPNLPPAEPPQLSVVKQRD